MASSLIPRSMRPYQLPVAMHGQVEDLSWLDSPTTPSAPMSAAAPTPASIPHFRLPAKNAAHSVFDADASWTVLGNHSEEYQQGVGVDYLYDVGGLEPGQPLVQQALSIQDGNLPPSLRFFHFAGAYYRLPAQPTDIVHLSLGIEAIDSNPAGQTFLLDGKALSSLLPLGNGNKPVVEIDEAHKEGFQYVVRDVDADGYEDVLAWIPHFSQAWLTIYSSQPCSYVRFWDLKVVSSTLAWMSSSCGSVYEYKGFDTNGNVILQGHPISVPGVAGASVTSDQEAFGLSLVGNREFYVVGEGDCYGASNKQSFIAHFKDNAFDSIYWVGSKCSAIYDVWMNPTKTKGYAGGSQVGLLQYNGANWVPAAFSNGLYGSCSILDIELDANGRGYFGLAADEVCRQQNDPNAYPLMYTDGSTLRAEPLNGPYIYDVQAPSGSWSVGIPYNSGPGIYQKSSSSWQQVHSSGGKPPAQAYFAVASVPGTATTWFGGNDNNRDHTAPYYTSYLIRHTGGSWDDSGFTTPAGLPGESTLHRIAFLDSTFGLAVGGGVILKFNTNSAPVIPSNGGYVSTPNGVVPSWGPPSWSAGQLTTQQEVTVDASNVYDPDTSDTLTFTWHWGDGTKSTTSTASQQVSHRYNDAGRHLIQLIVKDPDGGSATKWWAVDVKAEDRSLPTTNLAQSFTGAGQRHHYHVTGSKGQFVEATLTSCNAAGTSGMRILGNQGYAVPKYAGNKWNAPVQSGKTLAGQVSATQDLYLAVESTSSTSASCNLSLRIVPAPNAPSISSLPGTAGKDRAVALSASVSSTGGYPVSWEVNWDSANPSSGFVQARSGFVASGTTLSASKTYTAVGTYTVSVRSVDSLGQRGGASFATLAVYAPPAGVANSVPDPGDNEAGLSGTVTNFGGAGSVSARYLLYSGYWPQGDPLITTSWQQVNNCGSSCSIPTEMVNTLQAGKWYSFFVEVSNGPYISKSSRVTFVTDKGTDTAPTFTSAPSTATAGSSVSFSFKAGQPESQNVAYTITWGDGTSTRVPATGYVASSAVQSASHTYAFPHGVVSVGAQLQTASGSWSTTVNSDLTVGGTSPVNSVSHDPQLNQAVLTANLNGNIHAGDTQLRFMYRDPTWGTWVYSSSWQTASANGAPQATLSGLDSSLVYDAFVDFRANGGATRWQTPASWTFRSNQAPVLAALEQARSSTYLDDVRFSVQYQDHEGNAPTNGVSLVVNDQSYAMHPPAGTVTAAMYKAGVTYHYVLQAGVLPAPGAYVPKYSASDQYQAAATESGGTATVTQASVANELFSSDTVGGVPRGFTLSEEPLNYWLVVDTDGAGFNDLAALGGHGKAAWFGRTPQRTYNDPDGGVPKGTLQSVEYDLGSLSKPVLSFSSFFDTQQDEGRDLKTVLIQSRGRDSSQWGLAQPVLTIQGEAGGYKKWRTQTVDLAPYADQVVRVQFRFDAVTNEDNNHLGWLIDDFSIGHDQDGDKLPDNLELTRQDGRISRQQHSVPVADGGTQKAFVRRLIRPAGDGAMLEAIVSHPQPSELSISVGVLAAPGESAPSSVSLSNRNPACQTRAAGDAYAVRQMNGGLRVIVDLRQCGFPIRSWMTAHDWFLQVQDTQASDGQRAIIESLRIESWGATAPLQADTDGDGNLDGAEVNTRFDPLGHDNDDDGLPERTDPNDFVPSWAPALRLTSTDYKQFIDVSFNDLQAPLVKVEFAVHDPNQPFWWLVGHTSQGNNAYRFPTNVEDTPGDPDLVHIHWLDAYGNSGVTEISLVQEGSNYGPRGVQWTATDATTGKQSSFNEAGIALVAAGVVLVVVGAIASPGVPDGELAGASLIGIGLAGASALVVVGAILIAAPLLDSNSVQTASGQRIQYDPSILAASAQAMGVSTATLQSYMQNAQKVETFAGRTRWLAEPSPGVYVVIVTTGNWLVNHFEQAWKWQLPSNVNWGNPTRTVEELVKLEKEVHNLIKSGHVSKEVRALLGRLLLASCGIPTPFEITATSPGLPSSREVDTAIPYCVTFAFTKALEFVDEADTYAFRQDLIDTLVGETAFGHLKFQASEGRFNGDFFWYWDNDDGPADCDASSSTWSNPDIRRCNPYTANNLLGPIEIGQMTHTKKVAPCPMFCAITTVGFPTMVTITIPDVVSVRRLDWANAPHQFQDAFSSDGAIVNIQDIATNGLDYRPWAVMAIEDNMGDLPPQTGLDGDVRVTYLYSDLVMKTNADFRTFGS